MQFVIRQMLRQLCRHKLRVVVLPCEECVEGITNALTQANAPSHRQGAVRAGAALPSPSGTNWATDELHKKFNLFHGDFTLPEINEMADELMSDERALIALRDYLLSLRNQHGSPAFPQANHITDRILELERKRKEREREARKQQAKSD